MPSRKLLLMFSNNLKPNLQITVNGDKSKRHPKHHSSFYFSVSQQAERYKATLYHA